MVPEDPTPTNAAPWPFKYVNEVPSGYAGGRCQYRFRSGWYHRGRQVIGNLCGLPVVEGQDRCILHMEGERDWRAVEAALREAVVAKACTEEAQLQRAYLPQAQLERAGLKRAQLEWAVLWKACLEGADLSGAYLEGANLSGTHLREEDRGAHLEGAKLIGAHLEGAQLPEVHLEGAQLVKAHLEGAELTWACLGNANLEFAHLEGADLRGAKFSARAILRQTSLTDALLAGAEFSPEADLDGVTWWHEDRRWWQRLLHLRTPTLRDEAELGFRCPDDGPAADTWRERLRSCERTYRQIKRAYQESGQYDMAGVFFVREMECRRKQAKSLWTRLAYSLVYFLSDYFENPARVSVISLLLILLFAWVQGALGIATEGPNGQDVAVIGPGVGLPNWTAIKVFFSEACYFSVVTFTTLGYGDYHAGGPAGRVLASVEAIFGAFMMALFLVCLARKYGRS